MDRQYVAYAPSWRTCRVQFRISEKLVYQTMNIKSGIWSIHLERSLFAVKRALASEGQAMNSDLLEDR